MSTLAHEYTHGVTEHTADFEYENASGALDESYADVFAALITSSFSSLTGTPDHFSKRSPFSNNPECDASDPGYNDCGWVHVNNSIPNNAANLIINGGTLNNVTVTGVGPRKAGFLYYIVLKGLLGSCSDFHDMAYATTLAARVLPDFSAVEACNVEKAFAAVGLALLDSDCDGKDNDADSDDDNDAVPDSRDNCLLTQNLHQVDTDGDGQGNACDSDDDNDSRNDGNDNCPLVVNPGQEDADGDGQGDACDDDDNDTVLDTVDNCPMTPNAAQADSDNDGQGDRCDPDDDNDGTNDDIDNCPSVTNTDQADSDGDALGDVCDTCPFVDNFPRLGIQLDIDDDGLGDECDDDIDGDGVPNDQDNCPRSPNPGQADFDGNGKGLVCDLFEQRQVYGTTQRDLLESLIEIRDRPIRIPILPCLENCPDWLSDDYFTEIDLVLPFDADVQIVDDRGFLVAGRDAGSDDRLRFRVDADFRFQPPSDELGGDAKVYEGRHYFLEIIPPEDLGAGSYQLGLRVRSGNQQ